jgi:hypothetical protein
LNSEMENLLIEWGYSHLVSIFQGKFFIIFIHYNNFTMRKRMQFFLLVFC